MLIITIDGPAGSGKSTIARLVAEELALPFLDTGAMYRGMAFFFIEHGIGSKDTEKIDLLAPSVDLTFEGSRIFLESRDITGEIRSPEISDKAPLYASLPSVRKHLLSLQRRQAQEPGLVAEGRDMGTVVFPKASFKFFLTATPEERARRRFSELRKTDKAFSASYEEILKSIIARDALDTNRAEAPLQKALDAVEIDTTGLSIEEVTHLVVGSIT